ncbi:MAG: hypothetical protein LH478_04100 [Chitinophagaceae bacterium]|nr:hypothetical protein [Chitinophagaceae bacterium]
MAQKYEPSSNENSSFADQSFDDSSFKNNNDLHPLGIRLSYSVDTASKNLAPNATYPAWVFAYEILKSHSDYVTTLYAQIFNPIKKNWEIFVKETNNVQKASEAKALSAADWLLLVKSILNTNVVKELHGRVTIIALSLLDEELFSLLNKENYLQKLSEEVKEKMTDVFIPDAYKVFKRKVLKEKEATDSVSNKTDNPLNIKDQDKLDRYAFAEFIVELLNKINDQYCAYTLHLYAPWGAGKTSTLNFMKQIMKKGGEEDVTWHIVDFNAWQNQHLEYPWWNMMDSIYKQVWKRLLKSPLKFINEFRWRLNSQKLNYFFALSVIMWIIFSLIVPVLKN